MNLPDEVCAYLAEIGLDDATDELLRAWSWRIRANPHPYTLEAREAARSIWLSAS